MWATPKPTIGKSQITGRSAPSASAKPSRGAGQRPAGPTLKEMPPTGNAPNGLASGPRFHATIGRRQFPAIHRHLSTGDGYVGAGR